MMITLGVLAALWRNLKEGKLVILFAIQKQTISNFPKRPKATVVAVGLFS
jgi:hypothetical protein